MTADELRASLDATLRHITLVVVVTGSLVFLAEIAVLIVVLTQL